MCNRKLHTKTLLFLLITTLIFLCGFTPPRAEKLPYFYEVNNNKIQDDYFWLRDDNRQNTKNYKILSYLKSENEYANKALFAQYQDAKGKILKELKNFIVFNNISEYVEKGAYYYYTRLEDGKNYKIHCRKHKAQTAKEEVILNENFIAEKKKFMDVGSVSVSDNHKFLAYAVDYVGNERYTIKVLNLTTKKYLKDKIPNVSLSDTPVNILWHKSNVGFFYTPNSSLLFPEKVMFHKLGADYANDMVVYHEQNKEFTPIISKSKDGRYIFINSTSCNSNEIYYVDMDSGSFDAKLIQPRQNNLFYSVEHHENDFYIRTNDLGNNFRLVKFNVNKSINEGLREIIPVNRKKYLESFDVAKDYLILNYKENGLPSIEIIDVKTNKKQLIILPGKNCMAIGYSSNFNRNDIRVRYSSLNTPETIYQYNFSRNNLTTINVSRTPYDFNPSEYVLERQWAMNNGAKIPITIFYKKSLFNRNGDNPLYLYGYGSYGAGVSLQYRPEILPLVNKGFIFAIAHCRGGDELGNDWYLGGKQLNKKHTFTDFVACSEFLVTKKYTSTGKIIINGRSAGGLLIGSVINIKPELYKAAIMHEPFVDALNTMLDESIPFTSIEFQEWGDPKEPKYFEYIRSYSPYDNIKKQDYPNILVTTSINDPRVGYWESAKFVAKLREYKTDNNKLIFITNFQSGHVGSTGQLDHLEELANDYIFIYDVFDIL